MVTSSEGAINLVMIVEFIRIAARVVSEWPGARGLIEAGFAEEFLPRLHPPRCLPEARAGVEYEAPGSRPEGDRVQGSPRPR